MITQADAFLRPEPITITIKEAVRLSSLGRSTLYEKLADGSIASVKADKRRLVVYASLREYLISLPTEAPKRTTSP